MDALKSFVLADGNEVLVAVTNVADGSRPAMRGIGGASVERLADKAVTSLVAALQGVVEAAAEVKEAIDRQTRAPDEVTVSFGVGLTAGADAFIASGEASANLTVTLTWKSQPAGEREGPTP